jgi:hypothetical protein
MTHEDARIIFGNILDLAELADDFVPRLETALGSVVPSGDGEEIASALFVEMVRSFPLSSGPFLPSTKPFQDFPYGASIYALHPRHPAAFAQLGSLPQTPALAAYHNTTRSLCPATLTLVGPPISPYQTRPTFSQICTLTPRHH